MKKLLIIFLLLSSTIMAGQIPDLSGLDRKTRGSIEGVCSGKYYDGPVAYANCINSQLESIAGFSGVPDLSGLDRKTRGSIEGVCSGKYYDGPVAYANCINSQLESIAGFSGVPDLSGLDRKTRGSIEGVCSGKYYDGPVAYANCINSQLESIGIKSKKAKPEYVKPTPEPETTPAPEYVKPTPEPTGSVDGKGLICKPTDNPKALQDSYGFWFDNKKTRGYSIVGHSIEEFKLSEYIEEGTDKIYWDSTTVDPISFIAALFGMPTVTYELNRKNLNLTLTAEEETDGEVNSERFLYACIPVEQEKEINDFLNEIIEIETKDNQF